MRIILKRFLRGSIWTKKRPVNCPLVGHFKPSSSQCPTSDEEKNEMQKIPYASAVGSYAMVCT